MDIYDDIVRSAVGPHLRGRGVQIGGIRLNEEITRVELFTNKTYRARGRDVTVPSDSLLLFSQGEMDQVIFPLSIESLPDPIRIFREARRVIKEKGELLIVAVDGRQANGPAAEGHMHAYTPAFLARLVELAGGFSIRALREVSESGLVFLKAERNVRADVRIPLVTYTPAFVEASQSPEGCAELFFQLGIMYMQIGDTKRSVDSFEQVLAFEPNSAEAFGGLGMASLCGEDNSAARQWFEKAIAQDPSNSDYRKWLELAMEGESAKEPDILIPRPAEAPAKAPVAPVLGSPPVVPEPTS